MSKSDDKIKIYNKANHLKRRLSGGSENPNAPGKIDDKAMKEADKVVAQMCEIYPDQIEKCLNLLEEKWKQMRDLPQSEERTAKAEEVFILAHEAKDISAQCGYELMAYFAENLRDYVTHTDFSMEAQRVITQACVDAMKVVHKQGFKVDEDAGPVSDELKKVLKRAIDKFS